MRPGGEVVELMHNGGGTRNALRSHLPETVLTNGVVGFKCGELGVTSQRANQRRQAANESVSAMVRGIDQGI